MSQQPLPLMRFSGDPSSSNHGGGRTPGLRGVVEGKGCSWARPPEVQRDSPSPSRIQGTAGHWARAEAGEGSGQEPWGGEKRAVDSTTSVVGVYLFLRMPLIYNIILVSGI